MVGGGGAVHVVVDLLQGPEVGVHHVVLEEEGPGFAVQLASGLGCLGMKNSFNLKIACFSEDFEVRGDLPRGCLKVMCATSSRRVLALEETWRMTSRKPWLLLPRRMDSADTWCSDKTLSGRTTTLFLALWRTERIAFTRPCAMPRDVASFSALAFWEVWHCRISL